MIIYLHMLSAVTQPLQEKKNMKKGNKFNVWKERNKIKGKRERGTV